MKKGLIFTIEALFLAIVLLSLLVLQNTTFELPLTSTNKLDSTILTKIYENDSDIQIIDLTKDNYYCKTYPKYSFDENKIIINKYCE